MAPRTLRRGWSAAVRLALSAVLIAGLAYHIGSADILAQMKAVRWELMMIVVLVLASSVVFVTPRWTVILSALGYRIRSAALVGSVFVGFLFNQLLPTGVGGDVFRVWRAHQLGVPAEVAIHSVLIDRAAGVLVSLVGAMALLPFVGAGPAQSSLAWIIGIVAFAGLIGALALWGLNGPRARPGFWFANVRRVLTALNGSVGALAMRPVAAFFVFVLACANQLLPVIAIWLLARELHVDLPPLDIAMVVLVSALAATIPVSVAGWGVREGALVFLFGLYGIRSEVAFAISVLYGASLTLIGIPGIFMLIGGYGRRDDLDKQH